jgi:N-acetylglucosaminyl-diphospho-decaprenol L-rhamnosyltransferase
MIEDYVALIIGYKDKTLVSAVLESLSNQTVIPALVIVVDNGGTFTEVDRVDWQLSEISTVISRPDNPGYGAAVNLARKVVGNSALLVLTHDAVFDESLSELLLDALHDDTVGSVGPLLHFANNRKRIFSAGGRLSKAGLASHLRAPRSENPYEVDWVDGAIVMYSPEALDAIDWLDERYFLYFEDVDTGWRLNRAGWQCHVVPAAIAYQQPGAHPPYLGMRNMALFARKKNISRIRHLTAVVPRLTAEILSSFRRRTTFDLRGALRGLRDGYAGKSGPP